jgi:hypothetical protein
MSEREGPNWPGEGKPVAAEVSEMLRSILADAESAADAIRHQADQDAQARRRAAETESLRIIEDARREAERFLADRIHRVSELSDEILERGQSVVERLDEAETVRSELAGLVRALGETAARLANEVRAMPGPQAPELSSPPPSPPAPEALTPQPMAEPEAAAEPETTSAPTPEPERAPEPEPEPPLVEPTPLRPGPVEPNPIDLPPVASATPEAEEAAEEPEAEAEPPHEPTPEEIELLERVRAAERERAGVSASETEEERAEEEPEPVAARPEVDGNGNGAADAPDLVEVAATVDEEPIEAPATESAGAGPDQALGARLVALQMAVAGGNRGEVESHLRRAFDLSEPGSILDDIFGSGTDSEKRVVWPEAG